MISAPSMPCLPDHYWPGEILARGLFSQGKFSKKGGGGSATRRNSRAPTASRTRMQANGAFASGKEVCLLNSAALRGCS